MKSRTSSCKAVALGKDMSRFFPVWVGYILFLILLQVFQISDDLSFWYASNIAETIPLMGVVNCVYGWVTAQALMGDLFQSRLCNGIHALPLKREHWFSAHIRAGILFSLIPTALMDAFSEVVIFRYSIVQQGWQVPLYWFAAVNIQYLFFFALAVFCAMCTGNRLGMLVVYGMVNTFSVLVFLLVDQLYTPLLYGVVILSDLFTLFCPVVQITDTRFLDLERVATGRTYLDQWGISQREYTGTLTVQWESWNYLMILGILGIVLLLIARKLYKQRRLESAGDFMAVRWMEPVFQVVFSVLCAAGFHTVFYIFFGSGVNAYAIMSIGLLAGWFAGRMFLERTTRVFRLKNFAGFALLAAVLALSLFVTKRDPLNVTGWMPVREDVTRATISVGHRSNYVTEDPEEIAELLRLHEIALQERLDLHPDYADDLYNPYDEDPEAAYVSLHYNLSNGLRAYREYYVLAEGGAGEITRDYGSRLEVVVPHSRVDDEADFLHEMKKIRYVGLAGQKVDESYLTEEFLTELAGAIIADCETGSMVQSGVFHPEPVFDWEGTNYRVDSLYLDMSGEEFFCYLNVYADCENTLAVLEKTGIVEQVRQIYENDIG